MKQDIVNFLDGYSQQPASQARLNYEFFHNQRVCRPDNLLLSQIHTRWVGKWDLLESRHGYIQWLFPIREVGSNAQAQMLSSFECEALHQSSQLLKSFRLMLSFYGMREDNMLVTRYGDWRDRYGNLITSRHNYLRITRILKCLSELGYELYGVGWVLFILTQPELDTPRIRESMDSWWCHCFREERYRTFVCGVRDRVRQGESFTEEEYRQAMATLKASK